MVQQAPNRRAKVNIQQINVKDLGVRAIAKPVGPEHSTVLSVKSCVATEDNAVTGPSKSTTCLVRGFVGVAEADASKKEHGTPHEPRWFKKTAPNGQQAGLSSWGCKSSS